MTIAVKKERRIRRYVSNLAWLPQYQHAWLRPDFIVTASVCDGRPLVVEHHHAR
jgi:hypothetical protein